MAGITPKIMSWLRSWSLNARRAERMALVRIEMPLTRKIRATEPYEIVYSGLSGPPRAPSGGYHHAIRMTTPIIKMNHCALMTPVMYVHARERNARARAEKPEGAASA